MIILFTNYRCHWTHSFKTLNEKKYFYISKFYICGFVYLSVIVRLHLNVKSVMLTIQFSIGT